MGQFAEKLLPWVLAAVAGLALAVGVQGFRAERPVSIRGPVSTTAVITEVTDDIAEVVLPDGAVLVLRPGTTGYDLARFLNGTDEPPAAFPLNGFGPDGEGERTLLAVAAILKAHPTARLRIEAAHGGADPLKARLEAAGIVPERLDIGTPASLAAPLPATLILVSR